MHNSIDFNGITPEQEKDQTQNIQLVSLCPLQEFLFLFSSYLRMTNASGMRHAVVLQNLLWKNG